MGYNTWDDFRCGGISAANVMKVADAFERYGLKKYGYEYIGIGAYLPPVTTPVTTPATPTLHQALHTSSVTIVSQTWSQSVVIAPAAVPCSGRVPMSMSACAASVTSIAPAATSITVANASAHPPTVMPRVPTHGARKGDGGVCSASFAYVVLPPGCPLFPLPPSSPTLLT